MIPPEAILDFADRQKKLLRDTYDRAWATGRDAYEPDEDPQPPAQPREIALAGLTGAALLAAKRSYPYEPPRAPDAATRAVALAPGFRGLNRMVAQLSTTPDAQAFVDAQSWRLDAGESVAWSGEQAGYAEAAQADGVLLQWITEGDERVCETCLGLSTFDPMALNDWPCVPGDGAASCSVGCRCSLEAVQDIIPGDVYTPRLTADQETLLSDLSQQQAEALNSMMPDAAYLD